MCTLFSWISMETEHIIINFQLYLSVVCDSFLKSLMHFEMLFRKILPSSPRSAFLHSAVMLENSLYIFGGKTDNFDKCRTCPELETIKYNIGEIFLQHQIVII